MAFQTYHGTFAQTGGSGATQVISGLPFQPEAILFFSSVEAGHTDATFADGNNLVIAMMADHGVSLTGSHASAHAFDNQAAQDTASSSNGSEELSVAFNDGVLFGTRLAGAVTAVSATSFTITWSYNGFGDYSGSIWHYLAFGGDFIGWMSVGSGTLGLSAGTERFEPTGGNAIPFQPAISLTAGCQQAVLTDKHSISFGAAGASAGVVQQAGFALTTIDNANPASQFRYQKYGRANLGLVNTTGAVRREGTVTAFGWNPTFGRGYIDYNWATGGAGYIEHLNLGGTDLRAQVVTITQPAVTGVQTISGLNVGPVGIIVFGSGGVASSSVVNASYGASLGASDGTRQGVVWAGDTHGVSPSVNAGYQSTSSILFAATPAATATSSTKTAEASLVALTGDGFTLNWTVTDGTAREFFALVFGPVSTVEVTPQIGQSFGPLVWAEWEGSDDVRRTWAPVDLPDPADYYGGYKEPKLLRPGVIVRSLSDEDGQYQSQQFEVEISDMDRTIRTLLGRSDDQRLILNTPLVMRMISDEDRRQLLIPRTVAIGVVRGYRLH